MRDRVDTRDPKAVESEVRSIYAALYPDGDRTFVGRAFAWAARCFGGQQDDYQPIDARYHDFEHTMQGTLCLSRLLRGRHAAGAVPPLSVRWFELGVLAILFHDTGYLKRRADTEGTGAKYTPIHVGRSADFAREFLSTQGVPDAELSAVQNMIRCTGLNADLKAIPFGGDVERLVGFALATADLLGQMAAADYVEKLPVLYQEFAEAGRYATTPLPHEFAFGSADELMRSTPAFWEEYVQPKINGDFGGLHAFLADPWPGGPNPYVQRIEENIARLRQQLAAPPA
ncbi:MAG: hypothetical protein ABI886_00250 [Betaproteobacteria bacterium]